MLSCGGGGGGGGIVLMPRPREFPVMMFLEHCLKWHKKRTDYNLSSLK